MINEILETLERNEFEDYDSLKEWTVSKIKELGEVFSFKTLIEKISNAETDEQAVEIIQNAIKMYCDYGYPKTLIEKLKEIASLGKKSEIVSELNKLIEGLEGYGYPSYGYPYGIMKAGETTNLVDIEIFRIGDYKEKGKFTIEDLETIVKNFYDLKDKIKVPLKLGHGNNFYFEPPAIGWVSDLRIDKERGVLLADFSFVPKIIADVIKNKGYRNVSCEIYVEEVEGKKPPILRAVALLGATIPEVKGLSDLKVLYNNEEKKINIVNIEQEDKPDTQNPEVEKLKQELAELKIEKFLEECSEKILPKDKELVKTILLNLEKEDRIVKFQETETSLSYLFKKFLINLPKLSYYQEFIKQNEIIETEDDDLVEIEKIRKERNISFGEAYDIYISKKNIFNQNKEVEDDKR